MHQLKTIAPLCSLFFLLAPLTVGCARSADDVVLTDVAMGTFSVSSGTREGIAVLALANDPQTDVVTFDDAVGLDVRAARNIVAQRPFATVEDLDAVPYVGEAALARLALYALAHGYALDGNGPDDDTDVLAEDLAMLAFVNASETTFALLDDDVGLDARAAANVIAHRDGPDGLPHTSDDDLFDDVAELDAISYVGTRALEDLRAYAIDHGWLDAAQEPRDNMTRVDVVFSPQATDTSHLAKVKALIASAEHSIDIAMYSMSDTSFISALAAATARGVVVRMVYETANEDRKEIGDALARTKSARLERAGVDVRYVNKIMHHKFIIVDGPKDTVDQAMTARVATGSANWSTSAAITYDENTLFFAREPALALRMQREFNHMWSHARDLVAVEGLALSNGPLVIDNALLDSLGINDAEADLRAYFTSANFDVSAGGTTFRRSNRSDVSDAIVAAIEDATDSIWIASGHLRSRPISEALIAAAVANPALDIKVLLDGQEYVSDYYHDQQMDERDACLASATTDTQVRNCNERGFLFGYLVGTFGVDVRYSYSAYRWHYSYAKQMHHKVILIDHDELWTGSYNLSANAEFSTFENIVSLRGPRFAAVIAAYEDNFSTLWNRGRDGAFDDVIDEMNSATDSIPLVFDAMTLSWDEVTTLKETVRAVCPAVNSAPYRDSPETHWTCTL